MSINKLLKIKSRYLKNIKIKGKIVEPRKSFDDFLIQRTIGSLGKTIGFVK